MTLSVETLGAQLPANAFGRREAKHLLNRAGFGGPPDEVAALEAMGLDAAIDFLVDFGAEIPADEAILPEEVSRAAAGNSGGAGAFPKVGLITLSAGASEMAATRHWWIDRLISSPRPLEEKLTLFWHGHFASAYSATQSALMMWRQHTLLRSHCVGNFAQMVREIVRDPAMLRYLTNETNSKVHPDENLARELMELFTLGLGQYTERDVKEASRALTGYGIKDSHFHFSPDIHDNGLKTILGKVGAFDGDSLAELILRQEACPRLVCAKLYSWFVSNLVNSANAEAQAVIDAMAFLLRQNDYQISPVLKALFRSQHFYDPSWMGTMIKSPAHLLAGAARAMRTPKRDPAVLCEFMDYMGQQLFEPPSVQGWVGGLNWINTSTLNARQNVCAYLIRGFATASNWHPHSAYYDPMVMLKDLSPHQTSSVAVVDHLLDALLSVQPLETQRRLLIAHLDQAGRLDSKALIELLLLIASLPEYQLC